MGEVTGIEWCDHTFNPWVGCARVSAGCDNCYAETWARRFNRPQLWAGGRVETSEPGWRKPLAWDRKAALCGARRRVFCASLADVFDNQADPDWRARLWRLIRVTPHLDWLLLTKRPQNIPAMLPADWGADGWPNVWLGVTAENQTEAERRVPLLLKVPAPVRFVSCEPLLGRVDLSAFLPGLDWVICGGETGQRARGMHPAWARSLRDQCAAASVPFFFKQWGEWIADHEEVDNGEDDGEAVARMVRVGRRRSGAMLDGRWHVAFPVLKGEA